VTISRNVSTFRIPPKRVLTLPKTVLTAAKDDTLLACWQTSRDRIMPSKNLWRKKQMPVAKVAMHKIKEVLRLKYVAELSQRQIAGALRLSNGVVAKYLSAAAASGVAYPHLAALDDETLARTLAGAESPPKSTPVLPDFTYIHEQLKHKGVTRQLLWEEYRASHPAGYAYTQFTVLYAEWRKRLNPTMRQTHVAGERLFLDYSGKTVPVIDAATGEVHEAEVFVACFGASNYTYAEATWTQSLPDWTASTARA